MKWRPIVIAGLVCGAVVGLVIWLQHARLFGHRLQVHTGTVNEPGPYYGFWSGFGPGLEEFGILGAIGAGIYSLVKKYNCRIRAAALDLTTASATARTWEMRAQRPIGCARRDLRL